MKPRLTSSMPASRSNSIKSVRDAGRYWVWPTLAWVAIVAASPFLMMPNTDDAFYFLPGLGYLNSGVLAVPVNGGLEKIFFNFPTYSFVQGLFLYGVDALGISVQYFSHRLFQGLVVLALIGASLFYIRETMMKTGRPAGGACVLFLGFLGVLPFAQTWPLIRPEPLGLLFLVGALVAHRKWVQADRRRSRYLVVTAIFLGIPLTLHPTFFIVGGMLLLTFLYLEIRAETGLGMIFLFVTVSGIPLALLAAYYVANAPESFEQLSNQTNSGMPLFLDAIEGLMRRAFPARSSDTMIRRLVSTEFFLPLVVTLIGSGAVFVGNWRRFRAELDLYIPLLGLVLSIPVILSFLFNFIYIFGLTSFLVALFLAVAIGPELTAWLERRIIPRKGWLIAAASVLLIGLWTELHIAKFLIFPDRYLRPDRVIERVQEARQPGSRLFITRPELVPLYLREIDQTSAQGDGAPLPTYWLLPASGRLTTAPEEFERLESYLKDTLEGTPRGDLWFVNNRTLSPDAASACIAIARTPFTIGLAVQDILYKDHRYSLVRAASEWLSCRPARDDTG